MNQHTPPPYRAVLPGFNKHLWCRFIEDKDGNLIALVRYANPKQSENEAIATAEFLTLAANNHAPLVEELKKALGYIETPGDFSDKERKYLVEDIVTALRNAGGLE